MTLDPRTIKGRTALSKMLTKLFALWKLNTRDQMVLLGLGENSGARLTTYQSGEPLDDNPDLLYRVTSLLSIHRSLRTLFSRNRELTYNWMTTPNSVFEGQSPVEFVRKYGLRGLGGARGYLHEELNGQHNYIEAEHLKDGHLYHINARRANRGIWIKEHESFLISRVKINHVYLFEEMHFDLHVLMGTAKPLKEIEQSPFAIDRLNSACKNRDKEVLDYLMANSGIDPRTFKKSEFIL